MQGKIPVTIFTGFLGAGKTTLLSNLILAESNISFAIVINEFGIVSVDDILVSSAIKPESRTSKVFKLGGGLIAYEGDLFLQTMLEIAANKAHYDHVLIETSGLAVPTAVIEALHHENLVEHFSLDATLALLDTPLFLKGTDSADSPITEVFQSQILSSDVVVLNKIDKLTIEQLEQAESKVRKLAPQVRFIEPAWQAKLDSRLCLGLHLNEFRALEHIPGITTPPALSHSTGNADGHSHSGLGAHEHGLTTHEHLHEEDPAWISFCLSSDHKQERALVEKALELMAAELPLLRVKGFVQCHDMKEPMLVQGVRERIVSSMAEKAVGHIQENSLVIAHSHSHSSEHEHEHEHQHEHETSQLVLIGYELDRQKAVNLLNQQTKSIWY